MSKKNLFKMLDKYNDIVTLFGKESDRAAAILAASYIEVLLEHLLRTKLITDQVVDNLFRGSGPLSSFSARADMGYALGLIPNHIYRDLTLIRRIRNHFAHNMEDASFQEVAVSARCAELSVHKVLRENNAEAKVPEDARTQFLLAVGIATFTITQPMHKEWIAKSENR